VTRVSLPLLLALPARRLVVGALVAALSVTLVAAVPGASAAAKERRVPGKAVAGSTLGATIAWGYDVNAKGVGFAVWSDGDATKRRVFAARRSAKGTWSRPQPLSGSFSRTGKREFAGYADVAVDGRGRGTVVWTESRGKGVVVRSATSKGTGWSKPRTLSEAGDFAGFADIEVSRRGHAVVIWAGSFPFGDSDFTLLARYRNPGGSWSEPTRLDSRAPGYRLDARPESVAIDDLGVVTLAWDEISDTGDRIQVGTRGPSTDWTQQTLAQGTNLNAPAVATTADGRAVAAWRDFDGTLVSRRDGATWATPQKVVSGPSGIAHNLYGLGIADTGRVALLGQEVVLSGNRVRPYLVVQDAPGGAWAKEYVDERFPQPELPVFTPDLVVDRKGAVTVTWEKQRKGPAWSRVFVRTRTASGGWKAVTRLGTAPSDPVLGVDGKGRFSVVFGEGGCCTSVRYASLGK
jgi:hypothetical protein